MNLSALNYLKGFTMKSQFIASFKDANGDNVRVSQRFSHYKVDGVTPVLSGLFDAQWDNGANCVFDKLPADFVKVA